MTSSRCHARRVRSTLTRDLSRADCAAVYNTCDQAHDWTARWLNDRTEELDQDAGHAIVALERRGDTASEIYVRICAALDASSHAGVTTNLRAVERIFQLSYGESTSVLNATVAVAAALADQTPDPQLAALVAIAALTRDPYLRGARPRAPGLDPLRLVGRIHRARTMHVPGSRRGLHTICPRGARALR